MGATPQETPQSTVAVAKPVPLIPSSGLSDADYPAEALKKRQEGTVEFRLDVSERGKVTHCTVTRSSGHLTLDDATCGFMSKMRFRPARDASRKAVPSTFESRFNWSLPN